jgi:hypothetical protein
MQYGGNLDSRILDMLSRAQANSVCGFVGEASCEVDVAGLVASPCAPPNATKHAVALLGVRLEANYMGTVVSLGKGQHALTAIYKSSTGGGGGGQQAVDG